MWGCKFRVAFAAQLGRECARVTLGFGVPSMGKLETARVVADVVGVPVFFIQDTVLENLGDGTVRVTGCMVQNGIFIPQYCVIMSHSTLRRCSGKNALMAGELIEMAMNEDLVRH